MEYTPDIIMTIERAPEDFDWSAFNELLSSRTHYDYAFQENAKYYYTDWDDWESDMLDLSQEYPDLIFYLTGKGEEIEDIWKARFYNGEYHVVGAIVTFYAFPELF